MLPDDWTFLLVREALLGRRTFAQFRASLDMATDVLSARLAALVDDGILVKNPYREPGQRQRDAYDLTEAGRALIVPLIALQEWGRVFRPSAAPAAVVPVSAASGQRVRLALVDADAEVAQIADARFERQDADPAPIEKEPS